MYVSLCTGPASPPDDVETVVISSTSILVRWNNIPPVDQNGIITDYEVLYVPLETFGDVISMRIVNTSDMFYLLGNLEEYVNYTIQVRAFTSVGSGPHSDPIINQTLQDGKCLILYYDAYAIALLIVLFDLWHFHSPYQSTRQCLC